MEASCGTLAKIEGGVKITLEAHHPALGSSIRRSLRISDCPRAFASPEEIRNRNCRE
jgi:hypothetical protein